MSDPLSDFLYAKGISPSELADMSEVSPVTIDCLLAGHGVARQITQRKLSEALEVSRWELRKMLKAQKRVKNWPSVARVVCTARAICREMAAIGKCGARPAKPTAVAQRTFILKLKKRKKRDDAA